MAGYGGRRPGAGRRRGSRNRRTRETIAAVEQGLTPLAYLTSVYRDPSVDIGFRIEAAKAAAPYVHPRLSQIEVQATADLHHLTDEQLDQELRELLNSQTVQDSLGGGRAQSQLPGIRVASAKQSNQRSLRAHRCLDVGLVSGASY